ncbi:MAG TPA: ATP-binding protein [Gammaproteobacteria bacterium]|nr:ATP-binding protein [Gammaproteobacteria bacterium]
MPIFNFKQGDDVQKDGGYLGTVLQVDTRRVSISAKDEHLIRASIGKLVALRRGTVDDWLIGMVDRIVRQIVTADMTENDEEHEDNSNNDALPLSGNAVTVTLVGMVRWNSEKSQHDFTRSLLDLPDIGQDCFVLKGDFLKSFMGLLVKKGNTEQALEIGKYALDPDATAYLDGDKFFQRHAALLGSTGSGKSWTVATILERATKLPSANLIVFDLHGEYRELSYADHLRIPGPDDLGAANPELLYLPYWLMNCEELTAMFVEISEFTAHNQTLVFQDTVFAEKKKLLEAENKSEVLNSFTIDSPVPFDLDIVVAEIRRLNDEMVQGARGLKQGSFFGQFSRFLARIAGKLNDRRYGFLFQAPNELHTYESFHSLAEQLLAFSGEHKGIKVIDFSEVPSDVLPVMLGIVGRIIYYLQFWMPDEKRHPVALVCDEAHIYLPRDKGNPNQQRALENFEKIAKEGRKYGVSLMIVSQRPSDVSTTILSQCNNVMALRLTNSNDISAVKNMMPESMMSFMEMLPILDIGEALVVGDAVLLPSRISINKPDEEPLSATIDFWTEWSRKDVSPDWVLAAENMRRQRRKGS